MWPDEEKITSYIVEIGDSLTFAVHSAEGEDPLKLAKKKALRWMEEQFEVGNVRVRDKF